MAKAGTVYVDVEADASKFRREIDSSVGHASRSLVSGLGTASKAVMGDLLSGAKAAAIGIAGIGAAAIGVAAKFNKEMSGVGAVASASAADLDRLREAALEAGAATSFSASEAAQAEAELAKAGISVSDILGGALRGSLDLAAAGQLDLATAATIASGAMNAFDLAGTDVSHIADVMAAAANKSATDVNMLGMSLSQTGLMASQAGLDLETTIGALGLFADNMLTGSDAGTSFKTFLQRLPGISGPAREAMAEIGFSAYDANGAFVGLEEVAQRLQDGLAGLSDEQKSTALTTIFGSDSIRAATILMDAGASGVREYTTAVNDQGAAQRMAAAQLDNLSGDVEAFRGSVETALIRLGDLGDGALRGTVQGATDLVNAFNDFAESPAWDRLSDRLGDLTGFGDGFGDLTAKASAFLENVDKSDIDELFDTIGRGAGHVRAFSEEFEAASGVVAGLTASIGLMGASSLPIIGAFVPTLSPITAVLGGLLIGTDKGRESLGKLGAEFADVAQNAGPEILRSFGEIADVAGETLANVLDDLGPAVAHVAENLLPAIADAFANLAPAAGEFIEAGAELISEVLPELSDLFGGALPILGALNPLLTVTADGLGLIADHAALVVPPIAALVGYLKLKAFLDSSKAVANLGKAFTGLSAATAVIPTVMEGIGGVAATRGISKTTAALGVAKVSAGEFGASMAASVTPLGAAAAAVTVGVTAFTLLNEQMNTAKRRGRELGEAFVGKSGFDQATASVKDMDAELQRLSSRSSQLKSDMQNAINPFRDANLGAQRKEIEDASTAIFNEQLEISRLAGALHIGADEAKYFRDRQLEFGESLLTSEGAAKALRDALDKLKPAGQNVIEATVGAEEALDSLNESLKLNGNNFDESTEAGRDNHRALGEIADRARDVSAAVLEQGGSLAEAEAAALKYTTEAAKGLQGVGADTDHLLGLYGLLPEQVSTTFDQVGKDVAAAFVEKYGTDLALLPEEERTEILAIVREGGPGSVAEAEAKLNQLTRDRTANVIVKLLNPTVDPKPPTKGSAADAQRRLLEADSRGINQAAGGIVDYYGWGGFRESHVAQIAPAGTTRVWNEPETHGEAYIPLAAGKRGRALDVWEETGRRLGADSDSASVTQTITIVVNPTPGMSETAVGEAAYKAFAERARNEGRFLADIGAA